MPFNTPVIEKKLGMLLPFVVLASQSPARKQLLEERGCVVVVKPSGSDETHDKTNPRAIVATLAMRKLDAYLESVSRPTIPVIGADTLIEYQGTIIGKASSREEARNQLEQFSHTIHTVHTGYALCIPEVRASGYRIFHGVDSAQVRFTKMGRHMIESYLDTDEWKGAAGSYRIQGAGSAYIEQIIGDYTTVVGLPIDAIFDILQKLAPKHV